jgi:hypothetical protein
VHQVKQHRHHGDAAVLTLRDLFLATPLRVTASVAPRNAAQASARCFVFFGASIVLSHGDVRATNL